LCVNWKLVVGWVWSNLNSFGWLVKRRFVVPRPGATLSHLVKMRRFCHKVKNTINVHPFFLSSGQSFIEWEGGAESEAEEKHSTFFHELYVHSLHICHCSRYIWSISIWREWIDNYIQIISIVAYEFYLKRRLFAADKNPLFMLYEFWVYSRRNRFCTRSKDSFKFQNSKT
jgi:hypothetical protein